MPNTHDYTSLESPTLALDLSPTPSVPGAIRSAREQSPGFGSIFSDHMVVANWTRGEGWSRSQVQPYGPFTLDPAASVLHYGQAIFEGMKAYRQPDGGVALFRPDANAQRFIDSGTRLAMPALPTERFMQAAEALVSVDRTWVPDEDESSLYLRPVMFATEPALGVRPANTYTFALFASPAGAYFSGGMKPVTVWLCTDYVRATPGGTGATKCAGNYAATLAAQTEAAEQGCDQVIWLDAREHHYVEEMGGMNVMFVMKDGDRTTIVTPDLNAATILPGITRRSLLQLAHDAGYEVEERRIHVNEWRDSLASGRMTEALACGTAAVITSIGTVKSEAGTWEIGDGTMGPVTANLRKRLVDIQYGRAGDPHGWVHRVF